MRSDFGTVSSAIVETRAGLNREADIGNENDGTDAR